MADERVKMRLEILTKEAETNPNMETPILTVMDVEEQGTVKHNLWVITLQWQIYIVKIWTRLLSESKLFSLSCSFQEKNWLQNSFAFLGKSWIRPRFGSSGDQ